MARRSNTSGANDNGAPTWAERRHRDAYGTPSDSPPPDDEDDDS